MADEGTVLDLISRVHLDPPKTGMAEASAAVPHRHGNQHSVQGNGSASDGCGQRRARSGRVAESGWCERDRYLIGCDRVCGSVWFSRLSMADWTRLR